MAESAGSDSYPWYKVVEAGSGLLQGDFINECPVVIPTFSDAVITEETTDISVNIRLINAIVLSQSCDLEQRKVELVLLCPVLSLSEVQEQKPNYKKSAVKEGLKQGYIVGYHLMNKCTIPGFERELMVADFNNVYAMPFDFLLDFVGRHGARLRLLPPYVEHLSQGFARHFMRVGLPVPIDMD